MTIKELFTSTSPYMWGIIAILILYVISGFVTRPENEPGQARGLRFNLNPFALAIGDDKNLSASLLQFLIFTYLTIFAYVTVYAARLGSGYGFALLSIPVNLLILMGLSVVSATASKRIVVSYDRQNETPPRGEADKSSPVTDKKGQVALTKIQMLIWTVIAAAIYL